MRGNFDTHFFTFGRIKSFVDIEKSDMITHRRIELFSGFKNIFIGRAYENIVSRKHRYDI